jgi:hypothetical protein
MLIAPQGRDPQGMRIPSRELPEGRQPFGGRGAYSANARLAWMQIVDRVGLWEGLSVHFL